MSVKISQLNSVTVANLVASSTTGFPVIADYNGTLTTYQASAATVKTYVGTGNLNITGNLTVAQDSSFTSNLTILGNLVVQGNTSIIGSNNTAYTDNIIELHVPNVANIAQPWTVDDGKDIGIRFHYYTTSDQNAALVLANDSRYLEWYNAGSEGNAVFTGTSYGTMKMGGLILANSTPTTANGTGALQVGGGISTGGNLWVNGNIRGQTTISTVGAGTFSAVQSNGAVTVGTTLNVSGATTLASFNANTTGTVGSSFVVGANATLNGLAVNNSATIGTTLQALAGIQATAIGNASSAAGTFTTLTATGVSNFSGNVNTNNIMPFGNANANIGSSALQFNTIFAKATSAQYADLAEKYLSDAEYDAGTVVVFGGSEEVTTTQIYADTRVAGAVSTEPAYIMNSASSGLPVALRGKIPVKIVGAVSKGDLLVTSEQAGVAQSVGSNNDYSPNAVFAKSLVEDLETHQRIIWAVIV